MKKLILLLAISTLPLAPAFAQEVEQPITEEVITEEVIAVPDHNEDVVLPPVPWGFDFHKYFASIWVYIATILAVTQVLKNLFRWEDTKAWWLSVAVAAVLTAVGYFGKFGILAIAPWYWAPAWFITFVIGSKLGYKLMVELVQRLGIGTKK